MLNFAKTEKQKLMEECQELLRKISNHRYGVKLLISAREALKMIANYKARKSGG